MAGKVRMKDIAEAVGVSIVSVSKALNGKQDGLSEEMRAKILNMAEKLGYSCKSEEVKVLPRNIGVIVCSRHFSDDNTFYSNMYRMLVQNSVKYNVTLLLEIVPIEHEKLGIIPNLIKNNQIEGLIILGSFSYEYVKIINKQGLQYVFLDNYNDDNDTDFILSDGYNGSYMLTKLLMKNGHRNIRFVGSVHATSSIMDRYMGYLKALASANLFDENNKAPIPDRNDAGTIILDSNFDDIPDAYVCNCDETAYHMINILKEKGLSVPKDVSIVGFDDSHFAYLSDPPLTTYKVDMDMMSKEALRIIVRKMNNKVCTNGTTYIAGGIIERNSIMKK